MARSRKGDKEGGAMSAECTIPKVADGFNRSASAVRRNGNLREKVLGPPWGFA
ncbi:MAG: hypothetical protein HY675_26620 [Chloroflexi bacterium]|nr:hypothetical protein [Chloroflexota bacterium]